MMLRITAPHFVAGIDLSRDRDAGSPSGLAAIRPTFAPIVAFMRTWTYDEILAYCEGKNWKVERLNV